MTLWLIERVVLVGFAVLVVALGALLWKAWRTLRRIEHASDATARAAVRSRAHITRLTRSQVPLESLLQGWGMDARRAEQFAREIRAKVAREVGVDLSGTRYVDRIETGPTTERRTTR